MATLLCTRLHIKSFVYRVKVYSVAEMKAKTNKGTHAFGYKNCNNAANPFTNIHTRTKKYFVVVVVVEKKVNSLSS